MHTYIVIHVQLSLQVSVVMGSSEVTASSEEGRQHEKEFSSTPELQHQSDESSTTYGVPAVPGHSGTIEPVFSIGSTSVSAVVMQSAAVVPEAESMEASLPVVVDANGSKAEPTSSQDLNDQVHVRSKLCASFHPVHVVMTVPVC